MPSSPPPLVASAAELEKTISHIGDAPYVTVDTEFHRQSTYYPQLCLIQLASRKGAALIDPLAKGMDLAPFFALMRRADIVKVFHAARQDIEIIFALSGSIPAPLFDTQIAAMACGYGESISYDALAHKITGARLDKSSRFTDWAQRPLSPKQLDYALADVTHLRDIYEALDKALAQSARQSWLKEEMAVLQAEETYHIPAAEAWKKLKGIKSKMRKPQQWAALQALAGWREEEARSRDLPRGHVLPDDSLIEIAMQMPKDKQALLSMRSLRRPMRHRLNADAVLAKLAEAQRKAAAEPQQFAAWSLPPENNKSDVEILKLLLKITAESHNIAPKLLAGSEDLARFAAEKNKAESPLLRGWRGEVFGKSALAMLEGRLAIKFENGAPRLFEP